MEGPFHVVVCDGHSLRLSNITIKRDTNAAKICCTSLTGRQMEIIERIVRIERLRMEVSCDRLGAKAFATKKSPSCSDIHMLCLFHCLCGNLGTHADKVVAKTHHSILITHGNRPIDLGIFAFRISWFGIHLKRIPCLPSHPSLAKIWIATASGRFDIGSVDRFTLYRVHLFGVISPSFASEALTWTARRVSSKGAIPESFSPWVDLIDR
mmetsp:Transcript_123331/g.195587  ORF Transcript_123331/g.195587 Transcript_123331/m.195587 type:complete len:210 (-) Transcript_123331:543-1172(-)